MLVLSRARARRQPPADLTLETFRDLARHQEEKQERKSKTSSKNSMATPDFCREVDVIVIGDAFVDIVAPVVAMPQWGRDLEAASISQLAGGRLYTHRHTCIQAPTDTHKHNNNFIQFATCVCVCVCVLCVCVCVCAYILDFHDCKKAGKAELDAVILMNSRDRMRLL